MIELVGLDFIKDNYAFDKHYDYLKSNILLKYSTDFVGQC